MLLEINDIDISYGDKLTVQDFSLQLGEGKICSLVGESGSGKTTVIRAVLGLLPGAVKRKGYRSNGHRVWMIPSDAQYPPSLRRCKYRKRGRNKR